jgi:hypothetical protein
MQMSSEKKLKSNAATKSTTGLLDVAVDGVLRLICSFAGLKERALLYERTCKRLTRIARDPASIVPYPQDVSPLFGSGALAMSPSVKKIWISIFLEWMKLHGEPPLRSVQLRLPYSTEDVQARLAIVSCKFGPSLRMLQLYPEEGDRFLLCPPDWFLISQMPNLRWLQVNHMLSAPALALPAMPSLRGLVFTTAELTILSRSSSPTKFLPNLELLGVTFEKAPSKGWLLETSDPSTFNITQDDGRVKISLDWSKSRLRVLKIQFPTDEATSDWLTGWPPKEKTLVELNQNNFDPKTPFPFHLYFPECNDFGMK